MPTRELELVVRKGLTKVRQYVVYGVLVANEDSFPQINSGELAAFWAVFTNDMQ